MGFTVRHVEADPWNTVLISDTYSIQKLLQLCDSVHKWRLCIRYGEYDWTHPSGTWVMLGDAVHATLPYLASG